MTCFKSHHMNVIMSQISSKIIMRFWGPGNSALTRQIPPLTRPIPPLSFLIFFSFHMTRMIIWNMFTVWYNICMRMINGISHVRDPYQTWNEIELTAWYKGRLSYMIVRINSCLPFCHMIYTWYIFNQFMLDTNSLPSSPFTPKSLFPGIARTNLKRVIGTIHELRGWQWGAVVSPHSEFRFCRSFLTDTNHDLEVVGGQHRPPFHRNLKKLTSTNIPQCLPQVSLFTPRYWLAVPRHAGEKRWQIPRKHLHMDRRANGPGSGVWPERSNIGESKQISFLMVSLQL